MNNQQDEIFIQTLKKVYGYDSFRSIQLDIVRSIANGHDTLGLMPTGGGKSITFQIPALTMEGVCIVVTPLISLMKDQVTHLKERGLKAEYIHSGLTHYEVQKILDNAIYGAVKFLYISPERISHKLFISKLYYMKVCFITIDEAHCISQWGYDFRPSYLSIAKIRELIPDVPILALTATAPPIVVKDIQDKLRFGEYSEKSPQVFSMSFRRQNISYVVRHTEDKEAEMTHILRSVSGSAIIYTRNRKNTKLISDILNEKGIKSDFYHAGLDFAIKNKRQQLWQDGDVRVMVATNAFGMGIDKADVRLVIHMDCPDSIEAYFQEAGRAGRDGNRSYAVLLYNKKDKSNMLKRTSVAFPDKEYIRKVYDDLAYFFQLAIESGEGAKYEFKESLFCQRFNHYPTHLEGALNALQRAGYIHYESDPDTKPRIMIMASRDDLYNISNMSQLEERILTQLLRNYGSLFSDFTYIDEPFIAKKCNIDENNLHVALKELSQKRIIRYVPRRNIPIITYLQQRIDSSRLRFSKDVYEVLMQRMEERLQGIINYADSSCECRERMLIEYLGEKTTEDCGHCDVCLENKPNDNSQDLNEQTEKYRTQIITLLSDGTPHPVSDLLRFDMPKKILHSIIEEIRESDDFTFDGAMVTLKK